MLLNGKFGFIEVIVGDSFQFGPGRWRVEAFDFEHVFKTPMAKNGTVRVMCSLIEGSVREDKAAYMQDGFFGKSAFFSGCSVASLCFIDWSVPAE